MGRIQSLFLQIVLCLGVFSFCAIRYIDRQNEVTHLRLCLPKLTAEIRAIQEENAQLSYQIQAFESPDHLMELASERPFSHLKHPLGRDVLVLEGDLPLHSLSDQKELLSLGAK